MSDVSRLYLDDLHADQSFRSAEHKMDADQIIAFARQFDPQPFHLDEVAAKDSFFQGLAASGWHPASITMRLINSSVPLGGGIIGLGGQIEWPRPTRPHDTLHVVVRILDVVASRSKPDRGMVQVECLTLNQHEEVCQKMTTKLMVMRRPG
jgi:acyl dehydratase